MKKSNKIQTNKIEIKPRDYVNIAMNNRGGFGSHEKSFKAQRSLDKIILKKNLKIK